MADRIINANILKSKPKIKCASNNVINGVSFVEHAFSGKEKFYGLDINFPTDSNGRTTEQIMKSQFGENTSFIVSYFAKNTKELYGIKYNVYVVYFITTITIDKGFLLNNLSVNTEFESSLTGNNILQIHNPTNKISDFTTFNFYRDTPPYLTSDGFLGKCVFNRKSTHEFELHVKVAYRYTRIDGNNELLVDDFSRRSINFFADEQTINNKNFGEKPNIVLNQNDLLRFDTKIDNIPIGQHIANNIIEQYKNGKATINCSVNISDGTPLFAVGEIAKVYGFDGKSFSRNRDGTDKRFKITSAEWRWAGQETQNLEMVEVIE